MLTRGYLDLSCEGDDTLVIMRYAVDGLDVFGKTLDDQPYVLRISRDAHRI